MIAFTIQKNIDTSPRKLRMLADMVRKMEPEKAVETLTFTSRAGAPDLMKAIKTALANARGESNLKFKSIEINEGLKMKRYRVGTAGRGRGRPYKRRFSHIKVVLTDEISSELVTKKGDKQIKARLGDSAVVIAKKNEGRPESA